MSKQQFRNRHAERKEQAMSGAIDLRRAEAMKNQIRQQNMGAIMTLAANMYKELVLKQHPVKLDETQLRETAEYAIISSRIFFDASQEIGRKIEEDIERLQNPQSGGNDGSKIITN